MWSREFTPWLCLTVLPLQSLNPEFLPSLPHLFLLQKKAKPGTLALAVNKRPSEVFGLSLHAKTLGKSRIILSAVHASLPQYEYSFWKTNCMVLLLVSGFICSFLVAQCVSQWSGYCSQHCSPRCSYCLQPYGIV